MMNFRQHIVFSYVLYPLAVCLLLGGGLVAFSSCDKEETIEEEPIQDPSTDPPDPGTGGNGTLSDQAARKAVVNAYLDDFIASDATGSWQGGNAENCQAGDLDNELRQRALQRLNYYRKQVGYTRSLTLGDKHQGVQESALMMLANDALNHNPPQTWKCWTQQGYEASSGNLFWISISLDNIVPRMMEAFIEDLGDNNKAVGHRAWFLYPRIDRVRVGVTNRTATVYWELLDQAPDGAPEQIAWPPAGYVIDDLVYGRWSFFLSTATSVDASQAVVSMTHTATGDEVPLEVVYRAEENGFVQINHLTWEPQDLLKPQKGGEDISYRVSIKELGAKGVAAPATTYEYEVILIDGESLREENNVARARALQPSYRIL